MLNPTALASLDQPITIGEKTYRLGQLTFRDKMKIHERILSLRSDPLAVAAEMAGLLEPEQRQAFVEKAYADATKARQVTAREMDEFEHSLPGYAFCFWLSLQKHHPDISEDQAADLLDRYAQDTLREVVAALKERVPDATADEIREAVTELEDGVLGALWEKISGMPEGNPSTPGRPGTSTDRSAGDNGSTR